MTSISKQSVERLFERLGLTISQATLLLDESGDEPVLRLYVYDSRVSSARLRLHRWAGLPLEIERTDAPQLHWC
jgi:hypothetical protein